uniref:Uncharacterized protein n=1 Tax=viral metagenome TaxID=1070528 RepID=A0A6H1ZEV5_9ZZZZ
MKKTIKEKCPNCENPDKNIEPTIQGKCGVCGGKGYIIWKAIGKIVANKLNGLKAEEGKYETKRNKI